MTDQHYNNRPIPAKLYGLDHLRALAIILVFLFHYQNPIFAHPEWVPVIARFGWTGVDLFFVLSGFLISSQLFARIKTGKSISLKDFFIKRSFRILPAFFVVVTIYFLFPAFHEREHLPPLWRFLTFTQNLGLNIKETGTFSHAWSLCVEEHFYLFLPFSLIALVASNFFKKAYILLIVLFVAGMGLRIYSWHQLYYPVSELTDGWAYWYKYIYYPTYTRLDGLIAGVSIAGFYHFYPAAWNRLSRYGNLLTLFGLVILIWSYFVCLDSPSYIASVFGFPLVALGYGIVVLSAICPTSLLYKWNSKITTTIATLSYAIYLSHKGVIHLTQKAGGLLHLPADGNLMMLLCVVSCFMAAILLHLLFEKPFMKWRRKFTSTITSKTK